MPRGLQLENRNQILGIHQGFVLAPLIQAELAFVGPLCKLGDAVLDRLRYAPRGFRIQALAEGAQLPRRPSSNQRCEAKPGNAVKQLEA